MVDTKERVSIVDIIRHGQCEGGEIYRGSTDVALTDIGWQQMSLAAGRIDPRWQRIVSSPLIRCRDFAQSLANQYRLPLLVEAGFREMHFGDWEGRALTEVWESDKETVSGFYRDPESVIPPGGEGAVKARDRIAQAWTCLMNENAGDHLLLVCHGGTIRLLLSYLLQLPLATIAQWHVPYASLSRIKIFHRPEGDWPVLEYHNLLGASD
ncbi:MAG: histidine phosphatase family protein [Pseudomonadales bacterium]